MRPRNEPYLAAIISGLSFGVLFLLGMGLGCASGMNDELSGDCHLGTLGCQCFEGTCEVGFCSDTSGRCVLDEDGAETGSTGEEDSAEDGTGGECEDLGTLDCPCGLGQSCDVGLACVDDVCEDPSVDCDFADLANDPENCGACGNVCGEVSPVHPAMCQFGTCAARISECFPMEMGTETCAERCDGAGAVCSEGACNGRVLFQFADQSTCDSFDAVEILPSGCEERLPEDNPDAMFRCCCEGL